MRYLFICISLFLLNLSQKLYGQQVKRPKLVVGIVIDQMRWDYLYRYYDRYGEGGFKRLMNEGFSCQNAMINYLPSFTGPGHACVYTGSVPAIHGIVANDWHDKTTGANINCVADPKVHTIGGSQKAGRMSPANMLTTTVTDEMRLATNMRSKVYGIAMKDRGSILPAGHLANGAFWFDDSTGNFITSTYYSNELPGWVEKFNAKRYADSIVQGKWGLLYDAASYSQSLSDNNRYEGILAGESAPVFPHTVRGIKRYNGVRYMPDGNSLIFKMAKSCIRNEALGQDDNTDFLCLSFSNTDYVGHRFAPNSIEIEDMFLRLDADIANFLNYLDKKAGAGMYTVFLTADHGGAHNPEYMKDMKVPAGVSFEGDNLNKLNAYLKQKLAIDSVVQLLYDYQVILNEKRIKTEHLNRDEVKDLVSGWLKEQPGVAYVADLENTDGNVLPEPVREMVVNGYYAPRCGSLQVIYEPGWYSNDVSTGTTHGTWNPYDTHIPLLWYGWGIPKGEIYQQVNMTDIAPTLSALLHIQMPNGCIGKPISKMLDKK